MKSCIRAFALVVMLCALVACGGNTLHKPTTAGNAGTTALVAYAAAAFTASQYLALPLCATPAVYPCKTQSVNDRLVAADQAAYSAAKAADAAGDPTRAEQPLGYLNALNSQPAVKNQLDLAKAKTGGAP